MSLRRAVPVLMLVRYAYDVPVNPSPRLSGLPAWRETYDIEAKAPANAIPPGLPESEKRDRMQRMLRGLLADRFKLVMRVEQKTMPAYALSVASGGPSLQKLGLELKRQEATVPVYTVERILPPTQASGTSESRNVR